MALCGSPDTNGHHEIVGERKPLAHNQRGPGLIVGQENKEQDGGCNIDQQTAENNPIPECFSKGQVAPQEGKELVHFSNMNAKTARSQSGRAEGELSHSCP
jgi:hypothetical protein